MQQLRPELRLIERARSTSASVAAATGLTQFTHADDNLRGVVLTGRAAAHFKEFIARSAIAVLRHPCSCRPARRLAAGAVQPVAEFGAGP